MWMRPNFISGDDDTYLSNCNFELLIVSLRNLRASPNL